MSDPHVRSPCPILILVFPSRSYYLGIGVLSVILDQIRLGEMLGYIVVPGAVWILSLISEDNHCTSA